MKIELNADGLNNKKTIILSDENLDNDNFVDIILDNEELTVNLSELSSAIYAFEVKATKNERYEKE